MATILIVDDEVTFARNAAKYLERFGHTVATAATVAEGKALAETQKPEALVLDYRLPDGTGLEFIEHIRATDPSVYIILITGHGTIELAVDAMKAGANDLLTKPVSLLELRERIDVLMKIAENQETHFLKPDLAAARLEQVVEIDPTHEVAFESL